MESDERVELEVLLEAGGGFEPVVFCCFKRASKLDALLPHV